MKKNELEEFKKSLLTKLNATFADKNCEDNVMMEDPFDVLSAKS